MQTMILPSFPQLKGEEAITALNRLLKELVTKDKKLTKKQAKIPTKLANWLIYSIKVDRTELNGCNFVEGV